MMMIQMCHSKVNCFLCKCGERKLSIEPDEPGWIAPKIVRCRCGKTMLSAGYPPGIQHMGDKAEIEFFIPKDSNEVKKVLEDILPFGVITYGDAQRSYQRATDLKIYIYKLKTRQQ